MKVLAKATAILVPMAVPCIHRPEWGDISETFVRGLFVCFFFYKVNEVPCCCRFLDFGQVVENRYWRRSWCWTEPFFGHFIIEIPLVQLVYEIHNPFSCFRYHG